MNGFVAEAQKRFVLASSIVALLTFGSRSLHVHLLNEVLELDVSQSLCKAIGNHLIGWDVR